jgi:hypothetical protein
MRTPELFFAKDFRVSEEAARLTISFFLLGYCAGPFVFAPLSEIYGGEKSSALRF